MSELGKTVLPPGWRWSTIPELVGNDGVFIDGDWVESKDQDPDGDVRLIQLADVGDGVYRDKSDRFMTKAKAEELRCTFLQKGDVLIARMPDPLGRACIFPGDDKPSVTVVDVAISRSGNSEFDHRWLANFVNAHPFRAAISGLQAGSTRKRISRANLGTIPLPVPPLKEQRRIVAEIEKQFTRLDAGVAALRRTQANLKRYRAAVLKAACEGRLVPTEAELAKQQSGKRDSIARKSGTPDFESGAMLLERILTERRKFHEQEQEKAARKKKYKEPTAPTIPSDETLPDGWTWATWDQIGFSQNGRPFPSADYQETGFKLLRPGNLHVSGRVVWTENNTRCLPQRFADENSDLIVDGGELVMNLTAQSLKDEFLGRVCVTGEGDQCLLNQRLARLTPVVVSPQFVLVLLKAWRFRRYVDGLNSGSLIQHMFTSQLAEFTFALPPLAEQTRIVAEVERRLSVVDELETVVNANLRRATRLRQSILQRAFTSNLVPQNPSDGSAETPLAKSNDLPEEVKTEKQKRKPKNQDTMPSKPVTTLDELLQRLDSIGGAAAPDRLLLAAGLGEEVEKFFDLLRTGRNNGTLIVPTGTSGDIKRKSHEN